MGSQGLGLVVRGAIPSLSAPARTLTEAFAS
jgi:hypothetical protein